MRYVIAYLLPPGIDLALRQAYQQAFSEIIEIKYLHLSLFPTFYLKKSTTTEIRQILNHQSYNLEKTPISLSPPEYFTAQSGTILHFPIVPSDIFLPLNQQLTTILQTQITYDLTIYSDQQLPAYAPHVSVSYQFTYQDKLENFLYPKSSFTLASPVLLEEQSPNQWHVV